jgi:uncharacterized protein (DUF58 family)
VTAPATFLDPAVLARLDDLELLARTVVEGFITGLHRSPHLGASVDFAEHRPYMPGDDIRRIDWKLYARTDRYHLKEFEADTNTNLLVLLDVSPSMRFGSGAMTKLDYARRLAACLLWLSHRQRDRVGLATFDEDVVEYVPCAAKHRDVAMRVLGRLGEAGVASVSASGRASEAQAGAPTHTHTHTPHSVYDPPFLRIADELRRRGIVVVIGDFYDEPERVAEAVGRLRGRGNDVIVMHVLDRAELELPYDDETSFEDLESGERIPVVAERLRERYTAMIGAHIAELRRLMRERGFDYVLVDTARPLDQALLGYLAGRERLARVR